MQEFIFDLIVFVYRANQENKEEGECKIPNTNDGKLLRKNFSSSEKLLEKVTFRILSNINDGACLQSYVEHLEMIGLMVVVLMVYFICGEVVLVI